MSSLRSIALTAFIGAAASTVVAACSSNAGFGGAPPYPGGQPNATPYQGGPGATPFGGGSPGPTPPPDTPLTVDSASARFAYDSYAADPVKAPRLVEVTFALNNSNETPMPVADLAIAADKNPPTHVKLALQALPDQDTVETLVAIAGPKDPSKTKQLALTFGDGKGTMLAEDTIDFPTASDPAITQLDSKRPAGNLTIDDVAVTSLNAPGSGLHYDVTFSATNASKTDASIAAFIVTPPTNATDKVASPVKIAIPIKVPARTEMAAISIVMTYSGKSKTLPTGKYEVDASDGKSTIAQASGPLL
jgi:hypothetical protein